MFLKEINNYCNILSCNNSLTQISILNSTKKIRILLVVTIATSTLLNKIRAKNRITYIYDSYLIVHD